MASEEIPLAADEGADAAKGAPDPEASAKAAKKGESEPGTATDAHVDDAVAGRSVSDGRWRIFWIVGLLSLLADQLTKIYARHTLPVFPKNCAIPDDFIIGKCAGVNVKFIDGFWDWHLSMNPGSAFGLFGGARVFLTIIGIGAVVLLVWYMRKSRPEQRALHWGIALVGGGAIGNLIDRIGFSVVTDFISWHKGSVQWPVFNIADVTLVIGVGLMLIDSFKESSREKAIKLKKKEAREARKREALKTKQS